MSVFVDTGAFLAYRNKKDRYHDVACTLFIDALKGKYGQKKSKLFFDMAAGDELLDTAIKGEVNLIMMLKKNWSSRQHQIVREYREKKNQYEVAKALGITQQSVSRTLKRCMWHEIGSIEEKLNYVLSHYPPYGKCLFL